MPLMYYFYVLYNLKDGRLYKGSTADLLSRISQHNAGRTKSTKHPRPLILLYFEAFPEKTLALQRERWAKTLEGGSELRQILVERSLLTPNGKLFDQLHQWFIELHYKRKVKTLISSVIRLELRLTIRQPWR